jgi:hypothetical protein
MIRLFLAVALSGSIAFRAGDDHASQSPSMATGGLSVSAKL